MGGMLNMGSGFLNPLMAGIVKDVGGKVLQSQGFMGKIGNLFSNPMFAQLLVALGTDMAQTGRPGKNLNDAVVGNIGSQNIMKVLQGMLRGNVAQGGGIKITDKGVQANMPLITPVGQPGPNPGDNALDADWISKLYQESLSGQGGGQAAPTSITNPTAPVAPVSTQPQTSANQIGEVFNPLASGQLNLSANDFAGLNPNQILAVMELKGRQDSEETSRFNSNVDAEYKLDIMKKYYNGQLTGAEAQRELDRYKNETDRAEAGTHAYAAETGRINANKGTELEQNYDAYVAQQNLNNLPVTMGIEQFKAYDETGDWNNYQQALKLGQTKLTWPQWLDKFGNKGTTITLSSYERTKQTNLADTEDSVLKPDFPQNVLEDMNKNKELEIPFEEGEASLIKNGMKPPDKKAPKANKQAWETKVDERIELLKKAKAILKIDDRVRRAFSKKISEGKIIKRVTGLGWFLFNNAEEARRAESINYKNIVPIVRDPNATR
jgi:hypothetical protein